MPPSPSSPTSPTRRRILVDYDFELFHIVLFYLYTDRICFVASPDVTMDPEIPVTGDAAGIYDIATRLLVPSLQKKALHFLQCTLDVQNITARTFGSFATQHPELERLYDAYFMEHWEEIKKLPGCESFFVGLEGSDEYIRANTKFRKFFRERD
jgi:hypothetical protein